MSEKAKLKACYLLKDCQGEMGRPVYTCAEVKIEGPGCSGYRLPTEWEWEVAAHGRLPSDNYLSRYGEIDAISWYDKNSEGRIHPVKKKLVNPWGLADMLGNACEWTESAEGSSRVIRGGSWFDHSRTIRAPFRSESGPGVLDNRTGFRLTVGSLVPGQE